MLKKKITPVYPPTPYTPKKDNQIWIYPGLRRLMLVPWKYFLPDLKFIREYKK